MLTHPPPTSAPNLTLRHLHALVLLGEGGHGAVDLGGVHGALGEGSEGRSDRGVGRASYR